MLQKHAFLNNGTSYINFVNYFVNTALSVQAFHTDPVVRDVLLEANPELKNKTALQLVDKVIEEMTKLKIMTILNIHVNDAAWCCDPDSEQGIVIMPT